MDASSRETGIHATTTFIIARNQQEFSNAGGVLHCRGRAGHCVPPLYLVPVLDKKTKFGSHSLSIDGCQNFVFLSKPGTKYKGGTQCPARPRQCSAVGKAGKSTVQRIRLRVFFVHCLSVRKNVIGPRRGCAESIDGCDSQSQPNCHFDMLAASASNARATFGTQGRSDGSIRRAARSLFYTNRPLNCPPKSP